VHRHNTNSMSDKLFDALDNLSDDESDDSDEDEDGPSITDALGEDKQYWKSRNQTRKAQQALRDDEDED
jgi:hypothetical protein